MEIFIYRPDLHPNKNINPELVFTLKGQPFFEWKRDQETIRDYRIQKEKEKMTEKPDWKVYSY